VVQQPQAAANRHGSLVSPDSGSVRDPSLMSAADFKTPAERERERLDPEAAVTLDNVHALSVFELKQEAERRGLPIPDKGGAIGEALMKLLIETMVQEKQAKEREAFERMEREQADLKARLAREKEARKADAVARSKARQEEAAAALARGEPQPEPEAPVVVVSEAAAPEEDGAPAPGPAEATVDAEQERADRLSQLSRTAMAEWSEAQVSEWISLIDLPDGCDEEAAESLRALFSEGISGKDLLGFNPRSLQIKIRFGGIAEPGRVATTILAQRDSAAVA